MGDDITILCLFLCCVYSIVVNGRQNKRIASLESSLSEVAAAADTVAGNLNG